MQPTPNPPNQRSDLEELQATEEINRSMQSLSRSFQSFADAARALLLGGNTRDGTVSLVRTTNSVALDLPFGVA